MDTQFLRQQLIRAILSLPQEALSELLPFARYLRDRTPITTEQQVPAESMSPMAQQRLPQARSQPFLDWVMSHQAMNLPSLSDEAISRESLYGER